VERLLAGSARHNRFLFDDALHLLDVMDGVRIIVEIGAIRDARPVAQPADGWSTVSWASSRHRVFTVDVDGRAILTTNRLLTQINGILPSNCRLHTGDGCLFLQDFKEEIDLLYLDGPDPNEMGQKWAADAISAALPKMSASALILFDDCDFSDGGKGKYAMKVAGSNGYTLIHDTTRQKLLRRMS